jgi:hypothetical protein
MTKNTFENPFAKLFEDMPFDTKAFDDVFKNTATLNEKFSKVALKAAERNVEISNKWAKDALGKTAGVCKAQVEPASYSKAVTEFASASMETASENVAAFVEVAKQVQMDTVELLVAAGKDAQAKASVAVKKATAETTAAVKKTTSSKAA